MKVGDEVNVDLTHHGKIDKKHINRIDSVVDNKRIITAMTISGFITIVL